MSKHIKVLLAIGVLLAVGSWGCSLVGWGIGAAIDAGNTKKIGAWEAVEIKKGAKVVVHRKDNQVQKGRFVRFAPAPDTPKTVIVVSGRSRETTIPLEEVDHVVVKTNKGKQIGFFVGFAVDAALFTAMAMTTSPKPKPTTPPDATMTSCPILYSYDGLNQRADAELYAGAIFQAAERPDWDNLDFLKEDENGVCRVKMANEFDETQYVDFISLLAVDHPKGSRVLPSYSGKLFTVNNLQNARVARDFSGVDVRSRIRSTDDTYWLSNPFNRDLQNPDDLRDGLVLEFDRSVGTSAAVLVLNVQNTAWSSDVQRKMLELPGRDLPQWYDLLNQSERAREDLRHAMIREGMLKVSVWNDSESNWRYVGHVWEVGSALPKDIVVELDLLNTHTNRLQVKLECPPGIWMVNSVQVDYAYHNIPNHAQEITPRKAVDQNGRDVLAALNRADNQYHVMPTRQDAVDLEFVVPARKSGMARSYMAKGGGYYTIHMPAVGEPQPEVMQRMLREPGAFTRFALEALYLETARAVEGRQAMRE